MFVIYFMFVIYLMKDNLITQPTRHNLRYPDPVKELCPFQNPTKGCFAPFGNPRAKGTEEPFSLI
ncbi:hypothetical protein DSW25_15940 [Sulfitobacter donghicola DSW-25 = KCTC 12864 = JCM 14565]|uniref:Uncharacterized protein n=1 Tax=Sulfitobacter donghicola DSW-25 = KCTC 12864 = JCM 14565 TaxID=1300350 RepID=A0A073IFT2_9RHOB|nr:hypothetical protein DSW25_15940 [Sulfitobacter donghicola DSW-25 = KCTC 12864 = JCM 14565]